MSAAENNWNQNQNQGSNQGQNQNRNEDQNTGQRPNQNSNQNPNPYSNQGSTPNSGTGDHTAPFQITGNWGQQSERLRDKYSELADSDLDFQPGQEDQLMNQIGTRLNKSRDEVQHILNEFNQDQSNRNQFNQDQSDRDQSGRNDESDRNNPDRFTL